MKILFGIQGTGNGHVSRSTQIIEKLQEKGAQVDVIFSGCNDNKVYDKKIIHAKGFFEGFTFAIKNGAIQYLPTIKNISLFRFKNDVENLDTSGYDLIITDFEPITAMVAKKNNIPSIGVGHQYAFAHNIPMNRFNIPARLIMSHFAPADHTIGLHWHHFNQPIIPPIIPRTVKPSPKIEKNLILVYLPFEEREEIRKLLHPFSDYQFAVYGAIETPDPIEDGQIIWHPISKTRFFTDLSSCNGVLCNAGFELPSEALFLGKKLLVKPLKRQFEQLANASAIEKLKLGMTMNYLDRKHLAVWLNSPSNSRKNYPDVAEKFATWLLKGNWTSKKELIENCWHFEDCQNSDLHNRSSTI